MVKKKLSKLSIRFLRALTDALAPSSEAVTVADEGGYILSANTEVERVYGHGQDEVIGQHALKLCPDDFSAQLSEAIFNAIRAEGGWEGIVVNMDAKGRKFPIHLRAKRVVFGTEAFIVSWAKPFPAKTPLSLSPRESQIFEMLGAGQSRKEIAQSLKGSLSTVDTHLARIQKKVALAQLDTEEKSRSKQIRVNPAREGLRIEHLAATCYAAGWRRNLKQNQRIG